MSYSQTNRSTISLDQIARLWYDEHQKEEYDKNCIVPTVKHGGDNVKVRGCFA